MTQAWLLKQGTIVNPLQSGIFTGDMRMTGRTIDDISESIEQRPGDKVVAVCWSTETCVEREDALSPQRNSTVKSSR